MRKTRPLIAIVLIFFVLAGLYDMVRRDRSKKPGLPDPDSAKITVITHTPNDDLNPVWSPDGEQIAFVGHHEGNPEVYVLDVSSGDLTNISNSIYDDYAPTWSPDGQYLAFRRRDTNAHSHVVVRDLTAGTQIEVDDIANLGWSLKNDQIESPDGQRAWISGEVPVKIYVYEHITNTFREIAVINEPIYQTPWSPHGQFVGFSTYAGVYLLDTVTGTLHNPISARGFIDDLQWSPDGRYLSAFISNGEIALFDMRTTNVFLINGYSRWMGPNFDWSPDGNRLVFSCGRGHTTNLCLVELPK